MVTSISAWWRRAPSDSTATVVTVVVCAVVLQLVLMYLGVDRLTTLEVWSSPISRGIIVIAGAVAAILAARAWFAPRAPSQSSKGHGPERDPVSLHYGHFAHFYG